MKNSMNPMLNQLKQINNLSPSGTNLNDFRNLWNSVKNAKDPMGKLQQLASLNPQLQQILNEVNQNGGDAKATFFKKLQEQGMNSNNITLNTVANVINHLV